MNFDARRPEFSSALPRGPKHVVQAAKDPISIPQEPAVVEIAKRNLCALGLMHNAYKLTNVYGEERSVPYNASLEQWEKIAAELLKHAMEYEP